MSNNYVAVSFHTTPYNKDEMDILASFLAGFDYEMFEDTHDGMTAYVQDENFNEENIHSALSLYDFSSKISFETEHIEGKDWNEEWEKNYFQPMVVADQLVIHSSFHTDYPKLKYEIVIDPKMAFGTGYHSTTCLMVESILDNDMKGKTVVDMGTGTGILGMLASMCGAEKVIGIEIDPAAYVNAIENLKINNITNMHAVNGDASCLTGTEYADLLLANINRNIVVADLPLYAQEVKPGGEIYLSGFYEEDIPVIEDAAKKCGLMVKCSRVMNKWATVHLKKS